jgi:hypothetical protein
VSQIHRREQFLTYFAGRFVESFIIGIVSDFSVRAGGISPPDAAVVKNGRGGSGL